MVIHPFLREASAASPTSGRSGPFTPHCEHTVALFPFFRFTIADRRFADIMFFLFSLFEVYVLVA